MSAAAGALVVLEAGQNLLHPQSTDEHRISVLWWVMLGGAGAGLALIATLILLGWIRRNRENLPFGGGERAATRLVVLLGIATPIVILSGLFVWSDVFVIRSTAAPAAGSTSLTVRVVGHQWFWEIRYGTSGAVTANELHIPVRTKVTVEGTTADVIHSLWVPELNRKIDLIPGRTNSLLLYADRTGTYLGQCSEFCGLQHAHMEVLVIAQPRAQFDQWLRDQAAPAPGTGPGLELFLNKGCANCHAIRGTNAQAQVGPDLTHVGSRRTLAAGTLVNDRAGLRRWLRDPQHEKPGAKMPQSPLSASDIDTLVTYLEGLK
jgi:cytochrome c oxidase subunit 2